MATASKARLLHTATKANPRRASELVDAIGKALGELTVTVPGAAAAETVLPTLATTLAAVLDQRAEIAIQVEQLLDEHPLAEVLTSMPGIGVQTAAHTLLDVGDGSAFPTAGTSPPTPASPRSPAAPEPPSAASTPPAAPTTTAREPKARNTTPHSSAWHAGAVMSSTPCSDPAATTSRQPPHQSLRDRRHQDTLQPNDTNHGFAALCAFGWVRSSRGTAKQCHRQQDQVHPLAVWACLNDALLNTAKPGGPKSPPTVDGAA